MSIFTIYNPVTKHIAEKKEFADYRIASDYCYKNYPEGYIAKHDPFHFSNDFQKMLNEGSHPRVKTDSRGRSIVILSEDSKIAFHAGQITFMDETQLRAVNVETVWIPKSEFITLHNSLIK